MDPFSLGAISAGGDIVPDLSSSATGGTQGGSNQTAGPRVVVNRAPINQGINPMVIVGGVAALGALWIITRR